MNMKSKLPGFVLTAAIFLFLFGCIELPVCGNGVCETGETSQNCSLNNGGDCPAENTLCGNGIVDINEQCDDADNISLDGCSSTCQMEIICNDPDGNNLFAKGTTTESINGVTMPGRNAEDYCNDSNTLTEYTCTEPFFINSDLHLAAGNAFNCENGCVDGTCKDVVYPECNHAEGENTYTVQFDASLIGTGQDIPIYLLANSADPKNYFVRIGEDHDINWGSAEINGNKKFYSGIVSFREEGQYSLSVCKNDVANSCCDYNVQRFEVLPSDLLEPRPLYPEHNNIDANRINIVVVGANYPSTESFVKISKQLLSFDGEFTEAVIYKRDGKIYNTPSIYRGAGLFAIEPLRSNKSKFNFWYIPHDINITKVESFNYLKLNNVYLVFLNNVVDLVNINNNAQASTINRSICDLRNTNSEGKISFTKILGYSMNAGEYNSDNNIRVISGLEYTDGDPVAFEYQPVFDHESGHALFCLYHDNECINWPYYPNCAANISEARSNWGDLIGQVDPFYYELEAFLEKPQPMTGNPLYSPMLIQDFNVDYVLLDNGFYTPVQSSLMAVGTRPVFTSVNRARAEQVLNLFTN